MHVLICPHHWALLGLVDASKGPDYLQGQLVILDLLILRDHLVDWSVVLLVAGENVRYEWRFTRQESARYFERLAMPILAL